MSRFFVPKDSVKGDSIYITGKEAHHILDVMRLKVSDEVVVFDGTGREYCGIVKAADRRSLEVSIKNTRESSSGKGPRTTLIQAIPKKDKMDYIAEKATELGVSRIVPVTTERTIPQWSDAKKVSIVERWRKIAMEAAKQCGRADLPVVDPIAYFGDCLGASGPAMTFSNNDLKLIAVLSDKTVKLKDVFRDADRSRRLSVGNDPPRIIIAIGPEGDFTPEEIESAVKAGFKLVSLGSRVLKSDTAGLAVLSMINYEYEG